MEATLIGNAKNVGTISIAWEQPREGFVKLNVDGRCTGVSCKSLISANWDCSVSSQVYREGNMLADSLAKMGHGEVVLGPKGFGFITFMTQTMTARKSSYTRHRINLEEDETSNSSSNLMALGCGGYGGDDSGRDGVVMMAEMGSPSHGSSSVNAICEAVKAISI
ncbi:hypothetical protein QYF36_022944 [Acer negundo]|nr:hypothetical protein QYF36_022944 [Acer negundo]